MEPQTTACHMSISWVISIRPTLVQPTYWRSSLISSSHMGTTVAKKKCLSTESESGLQTTYTCCQVLTTKLISATLPSENEEKVRLWRHAVCILARMRPLMGPTLSFERVTIFYITWYTIRHWRTCRRLILYFRHSVTATWWTREFSASLFVWCIYFLEFLAYRIDGIKIPNLTFTRNFFITKIHVRSQLVIWQTQSHIFFFCTQTFSFLICACQHRRIVFPTIF